MKVGMMKISLRIMLVYLLMVLLTACTSAKPFYVHLNAASNLNQNKENQSLPLHVKLYLLNDDASFRNASFKELWKQDDKVLGKSMLAKKEVTLSPDENQKVKMKMRSKAKYFGVVGVFQHPDKQHFKDIKQIEYAPIRIFNRAHVELEGKRITILGE